MATKLVHEVAQMMMQMASEKWGVEVRPEGRNLARRLRDVDVNIIALTTWLTVRMTKKAGRPADYLEDLERELLARSRRRRDRPGAPPRRSGRQR